MCKCNSWPAGGPGSEFSVPMTVLSAQTAAHVVCTANAGLAPLNSAWSEDNEHRAAPFGSIPQTRVCSGDYKENCEGSKKYATGRMAIKAMAA